MKPLVVIAWVIAAAGPAPAQVIQLDDITAGGDGSGNAPAENTGIDPRTGAFTNGYFAGHLSDTDGVNPASVPGSPYIDSVFLLKGKVPTAQDGCGGCYVQYITQSGVQLWLDDTEETNTGWNFILKDRNGGVSDPPIAIGALGFKKAVGLHASMGITYNLDALRTRYGDAAVGCFSTIWGLDNCSGGYVRLMAMVSNDAGVTDLRSSFFGAGQGDFLRIEIPRSARYLTLVSSAWGDDACDHGTFARPMITSLPCPPQTYSWVWEVSPSRVHPTGELIALSGENLGAVGAVRVGGVDVSSPSLFSDDYLTVVTPPLAPGFYDLEVYDWATGGTLKLPRAIEVAWPPVLTQFIPGAVLEDRPTPVSVVGQGLRSDMEIRIDDVGFDGVSLPLVSPFLVSDQQINGLTPASQNGFNPGHRLSPDVLLYDQGRLRIFSGLVTYVGTGIEKVEPSIVATEGGTPVTIFGAGFTPGMRFDLGGMSVLDAVVLDAGHARGTSPPLPEGVHPARITLVDGLDIIVLFTREGAVQAVSTNPGPLAITSVSPARVFSLGGAEVTITTNKAHGDVVPQVGGAPLDNVQSIDALTLRGEIPALKPGFYDVALVATGEGDDTVVTALPGAIQVLADDQIRITSVTPQVVSTLGGTEVTITGSNFSPGFTARLGGVPLESVEFTSASSLRAVTPALDEGLHDASISSGTLELASLASAVTALPPNVSASMSIGHIRPARISRGTSRVRFVGSDLAADLVPRIGGVPLTSSRSVSPCRIEGNAPDLLPGLYRADLYRPGFGVVARFDEMVEVADPGLAPRPSYVVAPPIQRDGSTQIYVFGNDFTPSTIVSMCGKPLEDARVVSDELIVGRAPALEPGEAAGLRDLEAMNERGRIVLANGLRYEEPSSGGRFVRADSNASGRVDLSDAVYILGYLFLGNPTRIPCLDAADADTNGVVDLTDAIYILQHLFLGGREPAAPYPDCGLPAASALGCESFASCAGTGGAAEGGGGGVNFAHNFKLLEQESAPPLDAKVVELAPEEGEIVIHDPPGGQDVQVGDIIAGFTPLESEAMHNGVAYMLKVVDVVNGSCLSGGGDDKVFRVEPATLAESLIDANVNYEIKDFYGARRYQADSNILQKYLDCASEMGAGGGAAAQDGGRAARGGGGDGIFIDVDLGAFDLLDLHDGDNYLKAGFFQSQVRYNSGVNIGFGISRSSLTRLTFFAGQLLESQIEFWVDAGLFTHMHKEVKLIHLHKGTVIFIGPVPVLVTAAVALYAGVNLDAGVNLYVDAGANASYKAGIGFDFDGTTLRNISGFEPPRLTALPDTPVLNVDGFASVKGYIRPEFKVGAGLLVKALTGDVYMLTEVFGRAHVEGHTSPPCFQWGFDAGAKVTLQTEVQLFGYDLFDRTFVPVDEEWPNLLGGSIGCKAPPVAKLRKRVESTAQGVLIHLDASESYDPDGGPLTFRWDLNDDGQCRRNTGTDPRTTFLFNPDHTPCRSTLCEHVIRLRVTDDERTFAETTTSFTTLGTGQEIFETRARLPQ